MGHHDAQSARRKRLGSPGPARYSPGPGFRGPYAARRATLTLPETHTGSLAPSLPPPKSRACSESPASEVARVRFLWAAGTQPLFRLAFRLFQRPAHPPGPRRREERRGGDPEPTCPAACQCQCPGRHPRPRPGVVAKSRALPASDAGPACWARQAPTAGGSGAQRWADRAAERATVPQ